MKLRPGISYSNTLFENRLFPARRVQEIRGLFGHGDSDALYMDDPFIGFTEGMCVATRLQRVPVDDDSPPEFQWVSIMVLDRAGRPKYGTGVLRFGCDGW